MWASNLLKYFPINCIYCSTSFTYQWLSTRCGWLFCVTACQYLENIFNTWKCLFWPHCYTLECSKWYFWIILVVNKRKCCGHRKVLYEKEVNKLKHVYWVSSFWDMILYWCKYWWWQQLKPCLTLLCLIDQSHSYYTWPFGLAVVWIPMVLSCVKVGGKIWRDQYPTHIWLAINTCQSRVKKTWTTFKWVGLGSTSISKPI